jgi:hypothetical protein
MAEETKPTEGTPAPAPDAAAAQAAQAAEAAKVRASEERWTKIEKRLDAMADTVQASLAPRQTAPGAAKPGEVPAHFRQLLRQQGLTDADIDANSPIIVPFLSAMLATDGAVMLGGIQQVKDEVEMVKAGRNAKKFPYWGEVEDTVAQMREDAMKQGRYLSVSDAYQAAVATDIASPESKIEVAKTRKREQSHSEDVTTSTDVLRVSHGTRSTGGPRRTAMSQEEMAALPRAERKKLIEEQFGDTPIR